ncbi:hypothetical protein HOS79_gp011 [Lactobacillus phage Nyseid]|uniref:Uncharacterized protein n=1 Tax=Lactobacillus phage Nyseid TaxID=2079432 RepID=A0A2K9VC17_9CAUD|nr:hypothetical protein HOS79_gp011 [Lactobacillus phage Nyseid]AUV59771.1 hypothetical protein [Lactobacillus phage Nyseid]
MIMKECYTGSVFIDGYGWKYKGIVYTMGTEMNYSPLLGGEMGLIE